MKILFFLISIILCFSFNWYIFKKNKKKIFIGFLISISILFLIYNYKGNSEIFGYSDSLAIDLKNSSELDATKLILFLEKELSKNPKDSEGWKILARTCMLSGYTQKANKYYLKALALLPENIQLLSEYAFFKRNNNDLTKSLEISEKVREIDPNNIENLIFLAQLYFDTDNEEKFKELIDNLKSKNIKPNIIKELEMLK